MTEDQGMVLQIVGAFVVMVVLGALGLRWLHIQAVRTWPALAGTVQALRVAGQRLAAAAVGVSDPAAPAARGNQAALMDGRRWLLVGAPGSGKSTAARQLVRAYLSAGATVIILDPEGAAWPAGARMVGSPDDYDAIAAALDEVSALASARRAAFQRGVRAFDPLLVLVDEGPAVLRSTPGAIETIADLARRGRKLAISVILLATDTQAKTLGLEGQTRLLDAFVRLDARMTPAGVELREGEQLRTRAALDHASGDLVLPLVTAPQAEVDRLLASALGLDGPQRPTTAVAGVATPDCGDGASCAQQPQQRPGAPESPPAGVVVRFEGIDWTTVARLVQGGVVGETAALKGLGYTPGSTNPRYQAARAALHKALGKE